MNITEDKQGKELHLMLMSASPGILDGDEYALRVEVTENASLQLHTQAYQRLFNMLNGATQHTEVHVQAGASFTFIPHPSVPHENSSFTARNRIYLQPTSQLYWGEILTCGRKLNGEVFQFAKYHSITEIFIHDKPVLKENLLMQPSVVSPNKMGQLEGFTHQASFICYSPQLNLAALSNQLQEELQQQGNISFGVSITHHQLLLVRLLCHKAEQLFSILKHIAQTINNQSIAYAP